MKRKIFLLGALALCLTGCGQKKQVKTPTSSEQKAIQRKQSNCKRIIRIFCKKLKKTRSSLEPFVFPKDDKGTQQTQIVTYVGNTFKKLETINVTATDEELKKGIQQVGVEEAQKQLRESFTKDDAFKEALTVPGFTADFDLGK